MNEVIKQFITNKNCTSVEAEESLEFYLLCKGVMNIFILKYLNGIMILSVELIKLDLKLKYSKYLNSIV